MSKTITTQEAAAILKKRLGISVSATAVYSQAMHKFKHLAVREYSPGRSMNPRFKGINKAAWLNFLNARNEASSAAELFNTES
jgi:hypothetical protein